MAASRTRQPWAGRAVTEIVAYYKEICNLFSKTHEERNPVQDFPRAICQTDNSFSKLQGAEILGHRKWGQTVSMLLWGHGVPGGLQGGGCSYGSVWDCRAIGTWGVMDVICTRNAALECWSLFDGSVLLIHLGEELLGKLSHHEALVTASQEERQWHSEAPVAVSTEETWHRHWVKLSAATLLIIPLRSIGETPPICASKRPVIHLTEDTIPRNSLGEGKGIETSFASSTKAITPQRFMLAHVLHSRCEAVVGSYRMEELQRAGWRALSPRTAPALWQGCGFWFPQAQEGVNPSFPTSRVKALATELLYAAEESSNSCHCTLQSRSSLCFGNVHWPYPLGKMGAGAGKLSSLDLTVPGGELTGCHDMRGISGHAHSRISGVWRILMWKAGASGV